MNALDYVFLAIIVVFLFWGLFRGLVKEVVTTIGVFLAYWAANAFYPTVAPELHYWFKDPALMSMIAYFVIFTGVILLAWLLAFILTRMFRIMPPAWIEFPGGAVFGGLKGVLICAVALVSLQSFLPDAALVKNSTLAPRLAPISAFMTRFAPEHMTSYDPSLLRDKLMKESEDFRKQFLGEGAAGEGQQGEARQDDGKDAQQDKDAGIPADLKDMKDKILKGVQEMMNKQEKEK